MSDIAAAPHWEIINWEIIHGDCLDVMRNMADSSVDAVVTDPPYFRVKKHAWDNQWETEKHFCDWVGRLCDEWARLLKSNGSLFMFCSSKMAGRLEIEVAKRFNVLNVITWEKTPNVGYRNSKESQRAFFTTSERIIFAEHYGADNAAKGDAGYVRKCDEARGFVFEPLRAYLAGEIQAAGFTREMINAAWQSERGGSGGMASHWFGISQWLLPTRKNYEWLRRLINVNGTEHLRREYEDLRHEYEHLRRPFNVTPGDQWGDVWRFDVVMSYPGKHPCEKPAELMRHIVKSATRPGALVLDSFCGSGATGVACKNLGRSFVGIEKDPRWVAKANAKIDCASPCIETGPKPETPTAERALAGQMEIFNEIQ